MFNTQTSTISVRFNFGGHVAETTVEVSDINDEENVNKALGAAVRGTEQTIGALLDINLL